MLKYVILPGINDNQEDYDALVDLMKALGADHGWISRDNITINETSAENKTRLINAAGTLLYTLHKAGFTYYRSEYYSAEESAEIETYRDKLLASDKM